MEQTILFMIPQIKSELEQKFGHAEGIRQLKRGISYWKSTFKNFIRFIGTDRKIRNIINKYQINHPIILIIRFSPKSKRTFDRNKNIEQTMIYQKKREKSSHFY